MLVGLGDDGHRTSCRGVLDPLACCGRREVGEGALADAAAVDVGVEGFGVAGSQLEGRGLFPRVAEPVDGGELMGSANAAELVEHAAPAHGLELAGVAHEHQSPPLGRGEADDLVEGAGADHPCFVEHECCAGRRR